jgi:hypothetical protein
MLENFKCIQNLFSVDHVIVETELKLWNETFELKIF